MKKTYLLLFFIILIAVLLRFYQLGSNPVSLTWDEASWGYNAYSLGLTGKDEFGKFLPYVYLESFGDFKPPMYAYLAILPVKFLGLTEFAVRFPSAFFGVLTVMVTFFLTQELFKRSQKKTYYALAAAFTLAISPWHIMLSRAAFEANIATFFLTSGVWLFLKSIEKHYQYRIVAVICFVLSLFTFNSARVVAPLLVLFLTVFHWKQLMCHKKYTILACVIGLLMVLPALKFFLSPQASLRFKEVNIFTDPEIVKISNQEIANDNDAFWSKILHNRRWLYTQSYFHHYFDNFSPNFLFIKGDGNPKFSTQDVGEMYIWDIVFFVSGIFFLLKYKEGKWYIIPLWLLIGIIPAATARETPHALRIEAALPTFQILIGYGLVSILYAGSSIVKKNTLRWGAIAVLFFLLLFNVSYFLHGYYVHYPIEYSGEWQYGYKDSIHFVQSIQNKFDQMQVSEALGRPYIYYLFYMKTDPDMFVNTASVHRDAFGFVDVQKFGKYYFSKSLPITPKIGRVLYIDSPELVPSNAKKLRTFYLLNGDPALVAYTI